MNPDRLRLSELITHHRCCAATLRRAATGKLQPARVRGRRRGAGRETRAGARELGEATRSFWVLARRSDVQVETGAGVCRPALTGAASWGKASLAAAWLEVPGTYVVVQPDPRLAARRP
jgi:hypothetical protein